MNASSAGWLSVSEEKGKNVKPRSRLIAVHIPLPVIIYVRVCGSKHASRCMETLYKLHIHVCVSEVRLEREREGEKEREIKN